MARKDEARRWEVKMTISDQELFCDFYLWERIFVDSQINHKFVNPQICERGEIWECSIENNKFSYMRCYILDLIYSVSG
jgi:hypothetical protein